MRFNRAMVTFVLVPALMFGLVEAGPATTLSGLAASGEYRYTNRWPKPTWHLSGARGVAVDAAGNVYVADTGNNRVQKYDVNHVRVASWGSEGSSAGYFKNPSAVAVDPTGSFVYVADTDNHRIQKFTSTGAFLAKWGREGGPDFSGSGPGEFDSPAGIAVDGAGNVYVADTGNERIQKFSPDGALLRKWGSPGSEDGQFYEPVGIATDRAGNVYVTDADRTNSNVQKFNTEGAFVKKWGSYGIGQGQFIDPRGIAIDANGFVYVSERSPYTSRIQKFTDSGVFLRKWGTWGQADYKRDDVREAPHLNKPGGLATALIGTQVQLLVADTENDRIRVFDAEGTTLGVRGSWGIARGRFNRASGVAIGSGGSVYVADRLNHRVQKFDSNGNYERVIPDKTVWFPSVKNGEFDNPTGIAADAAGNLYVSEAGKNDRIQKLAADLPADKNITKWGETGTGDGRFNDPGAVAVGTAGGSTRVFVADTGNNRIQVFNSSGEFVTKWGTMGSASGQFAQPSGVALDRSGSLYVADSGNHRIQKFDASGNFIAKWGSYGTGAGEFKNPEGVAVDAAGSVYVADTDNHRVQKFTSAGVFIAAFGAEGSEAGQHLRPHSLAVNASGVVYVADTENHRIQMFAPPITVSITGVEEGGVYNVPVTPAVVVAGNDLTSSGVTLDGAAWTPQTINSDGRHTVRAWARDSKGGEVSSSVSFIIDRSPPLTSSDASSTYQNKATIALTATDALSGVAATYYQLDGAQQTSGATVVVTAAGLHTLDFWSTDRAGNSETPKKRVTFTVVDTLPPTTISDALAVYAKSALIRLVATDAGSSAVRTFYRLNGGATVEGSLVSVNTLGTYTLDFWSEDVAGNKEPVRSIAFDVRRAATLSISRNRSVTPYGGPVVIRGTLLDDSSRPMKNRRVTLYKRTGTGTWRVLKVLTSSTGTFQHTDRVSTLSYYKLRYAGDPTFAPVESAQTYVKSQAALTVPSAPATMVGGRRYTVSGFLRPRHTPGSSPVWIYWYRYERGRWVQKGRVSARASDYFDYTRYSTRVTPPLPGRWRIRAYHADAGHAATWSAYRYVTVR